jgi:hypothetical protein
MCQLALSSGIYNSSTNELPTMNKILYVETSNKGQNTETYSGALNKA